MTTEVWAGIPGHPHYQVSSFGRARSLDRVVEHARFGKRVMYRGKILSAGKRNKDGYIVVVLRKDKKSTSYNLHRLVAKAFLPNPKNLPMVRHLDENKTNNAVSNLAWGTAVDNYDDRCCWNCGVKIRKPAL